MIKLNTRLLPIILLIPVLIFFSCVDPTNFNDYIGVNLIEAQGFGYDGSGEISQVWEESLVDGGDPDKYMLLEELTTLAEYGTADGLPAGAVIYRLEIPNLIPSGDFEVADAALTGIGWTAEGTASITATDSRTFPSGLSGRVLEFSHSSSERIIFDTTGYLVPDTQIYSLRFDFGFDADELDIMRFEYESEIAGEEGYFIDWAPNVTAYTKNDIIAFPLLTDLHLPAFKAANDGKISIGWDEGNQGQEGFIDNLRITRIDTLNTLYLNVPYRTVDRPDLLSGGTYTFSIYVKQEIDAQVTPNANNRYRAEGLVMGINDVNGITDTDTDSYYQALNAATMDISGISSDVWTKISLPCTQCQIYTPVNPAETVLTLSISPTDWNSKTGNTAGSLLLSSPELTWDRY